MSHVSSAPIVNQTVLARCKLPYRGTGLVGRLHSIGREGLPYSAVLFREKIRNELSGTGLIEAGLGDHNRDANFVSTEFVLSM